MNGKDFLNSKWCREAASPEKQTSIKNNFEKWSARVNNTGLLSRAKQLFQFFLSPQIAGTKKIVVAGALLYIISPLDIIPDFIPVIGWLDDIGVASFALSYIFSQMDKLEQQKLTADSSQGIEIKEEKSLLEQEISGTQDDTFTLNETCQTDFHLDIDVQNGKLKERIDELTKIAETLKVSGAEAVLGKIEDRLAHSRMLKMAVVGRYSTGKSTLINSLLEKNVLPASPIPTTKAITYIIKGEESALYSELKDGEIIVHQSIDDLCNVYDKDIRRAAKITLVLPDFPFAGLTIADTPGLEDPDQSIADLTLNTLPEMDAVVVVLDANYMESKVEFEFISSLLSRDKERKLFVVINKTDGKSAADIRNLEQVCHSHLLAYGISTASVFSISAKNGNGDTGFKSFKQELFNFLNNDIRAEAQRHADSEIKAYSQTLLCACSNAVEMTRLDKQQQIQMQHEAESNIEKISVQYDAQKNLLLKKFAKYRTEFFLELVNFMGSLKGAARQEILNSKLETLRNTDAVAAEIKKRIIDFVNGRLSELDEHLKADFSESQTRIQETLTGLELPIEVKIKNYSSYAGLFMPTVVATSFFFCSFFSFVWVVLAAVVGRAFFEQAIERFLAAVGVNSVREKVSEEISRNLDEAHRKLETSLNGAFDMMEKELSVSFDSARSNAVTPLALMTENKTCDYSEITSCREKLANFSK